MAEETGVTFKSNKKKFLKEFNEQIGGALMAAGRTWSKYTKLLTPVRTGNLRNEWKLRLNKKKKYIELGSPVKYAPFVELGSVHNKAQHMLRDGIMNNQAEIKKVFENELWR